MMKEVRKASLSALLSERPAVVAASVGITYETKQSVTTQNIIHKGPVCRQQAELGHHIFLVAKAGTLTYYLMKHNGIL